MAATTPHTHGPNFGRRVEGCPRCIELDNGAPAVSWGIPTRAERARAAAQEREASRRHHATCTDRVCTYGDW